MYECRTLHGFVKEAHQTHIGLFCGLMKRGNVVV